jgi:hypothetical protein
MKKLLVLMLVLGMVCWAGVAFAQAPDDNSNTATNNDGSAVAQDQG